MGVSQFVESHLLGEKTSDGLEDLNWRQGVQSQIAPVDLAHRLLQQHGPELAAVRKEHWFPSLFDDGDALIDLDLLDLAVVAEGDAVLLWVTLHAFHLGNDLPKQPGVVAEGLQEDEVVLECELALADI